MPHEGLIAVPPRVPTKPEYWNQYKSAAENTYTVDEVDALVGATPDEVSTSSHASITAAMDAAGWETGRTGAGSVAVPTHAVRVASGVTSVAAEVSVNNTWYIQLRGDPNSHLQPTASIDSILYFDGVSFGIIERLTFDGGGANVVQDVVRVDRTASALNSVHSMRLRDLMISGIIFVRGIALGRSSAALDMAQASIEHTTIIGGWSAGNTTTYQEGIHLGSGTAGNVINFDANNVDLTFVRYGVYLDTVDLTLRNAYFGYGESCVHGNPRGHFTLDGFRSETTDRLANFSGIDVVPRPMSFRNGWFAANGNTNESVLIGRIGPLLFENIFWENPYYPTTKSQIVTGGSYGRTITFRNFIAMETPEEIWTNMTGEGNTWKYTHIKLEGFTTIGADYVPDARWDGLYNRTVTAAANVMPYDGFLNANTTGGAFAVTLPYAWAQAGRELYIKQTSANAATITPQAGDTVGGAATLVPGSGVTKHLISNGGTDWLVLS